jgi:hypothetical protein
LARLACLPIQSLIIFSLYSTKVFHITTLGNSLNKKTHQNLLKNKLHIQITEISIFAPCKTCMSTYSKSHTNTFYIPRQYIYIFYFYIVVKSVIFLFLIFVGNRKLLKFGHVWTSFSFFFLEVEEGISHNLLHNLFCHNAR